MSVLAGVLSSILAFPAPADAAVKVSVTAPISPSFGSAGSAGAGSNGQNGSALALPGAAPGLSLPTIAAPVVAPTMGSVGQSNGAASVQTPNGSGEQTASPGQSVSGRAPARIDSTAAGRDGVYGSDASNTGLPVEVKNPAAKPNGAVDIKAGELNLTVGQDSQFRQAADGVAGLAAAEPIQTKNFGVLFENSDFERGSEEFPNLPRASRRMLMLQPPHGQPTQQKALELVQWALRDPRFLTQFAEEERLNDQMAAEKVARQAGPRMGILDFKVQAELAKALSEKRHQSYDSKIRPSLVGGSDSLIELLRREARAESSKAGAEAAMRRGLRLYRRFFPSFFRTFDFIYELEPSYEVNGSHEMRTRDLHRIALTLDGRLTQETDTEGTVSPFGQDVEDGIPGEPVQKRIASLLIFLHEYAHGIFDEVALPPEARGPRRESGGKRHAFDALTEGYAVLSELLAADKMVAAREELGLSDRDVADLKRWKRLRMSALKRDKNHYTTGTFKFWHKIYKEGGEAAMLEFLRSLDWRVLLETPVDDPEFVATFGRPDLFRPFLSTIPAWHARLERATQASGLSAETLKTMAGVSGGRKLFDLERWMRTADLEMGGYLLGVAGTGLYDALARATGLTGFAEAYTEIFGKVLADATDAFLEKITSFNKPIVFVVPASALTHEQAKVTKAELEWFLADHDRMKNVTFVFGGEELQGKLGSEKLAEKLEELRGGLKRAPDSVRMEQRKAHREAVPAEGAHAFEVDVDAADVPAFAEEFLAELSRAGMVRERSSRGIAYFQTEAGTFVLHRVERGVFLDAYTRDASGDSIHRVVLLSAREAPEAYRSFMEKAEGLL